MKDKHGFGTMTAAFAAAGLAPIIGLLPTVAAAMIAMGKLKFALIKDEYGDVRWLQYVGKDEFGRDEYITPGGYKIAFIQDVSEVLDVRWLNAFADISMEDRKRQTAWVEGGKAGWLNPQGEFYSCNYEGHSALATYVLQREYSDLEREGWIHVDCAGKKGVWTFRTVGYEYENAALTPAQEAWLVANGHDIDPYGNKKRKQMPEMIQLGAYKIDKAADDAAFRRQMEKAGLNVDDFGPKTRLRDFR